MAMIKTMQYEYNISMPPAYEKFFSKFKEISTLPVKEWKSLHLVSYFTQKYFEYYKIQYQFKFDKPQPSKCFEIFTINRLAMYISKDPETLKQYIDWSFKTQVPNAKRRLTSISFLIREDSTIAYNKQNLFINKNEKVDRTTPLPDKYMLYINKHNLTIKTYGELSFAFQARDSSKDYNNLINDLIEIGLDTQLLGSII